MYKVSLVKTTAHPTREDIKAAVKKSLSYLGGLDRLIPQNARILIKPNIGVDEDYRSGQVTDWRVVEAIIILLQEQGIREIIIGESSIIGKDTQQSFKAAGYLDVADRTGATLVDLKKDEIEEVPVPNGLSLQRVKLFKTILNVDCIINVPKLKTVSAVPVSLSMKNLKGVLPDGEKKRFHQVNLTNCLVDLNQVVKSHLTVIDGIIGCDLYQPKETNLIIAGENPVATDAMACHTMGIDPASVDYLKLAAKSGLGTIHMHEISLFGEGLESTLYPFTKPVGTNQLIYLFPKINIVFGNTCSGCTSNLYRALTILKKEGCLDHLAGATIVLGTDPKVPETNRLIFLGNCTRPQANENFFPGCPSVSMELAAYLKTVEFPEAPSMGENK